MDIWKNPRSDSLPKIYLDTVQNIGKYKTKQYIYEHKIQKNYICRLK